MKRILSVSLIFAAALSLALAAPQESTPKIDQVFFAQYHVLDPTNSLFKLVGGLEALIKVQVYSDTPMPSPYVFAMLELDGDSREIRLSGPKTLPRKPDVDPVLMEQSCSNSFTAIIPKQWIKTGLKVAVELRDYDYRDAGSDDMQYENNTPGKYITICNRREINDLKIGAPTQVVMQFFDVHYFGKGIGADFPEGWEIEMKSKLPVADLKIHRVKDIIFNEIVMPPHLGGPSAKYSSPEDYKERNGKDFDGEQGIALRWCSALKAAAGRYRIWRPYNITICGVHSGGQAGGYRSCANLHRHGVILHELGHTFGLPHWSTNKDYPYKRTMYGKDSGDATSPNSGPTWAFDIHRREFLPPRVLVDGELQWKRDPMQGGGWCREKNYMYRNFSDYSIHRIQSRLENQAVYWNEDIQQYAQWNQETGAYDKIVKNDGVQLPIERDVDVISLLASANLVVPEANIIYPPIGPYKAGLIRVFDAESKDDRKAAAALGYTAEKCNVAIRVKQGGKEKSYLMLAKVSPDDDPLKAFTAMAINLPARDGEVTKAELLYCPSLISKGITKEHKVLCTWKSD